MQAKLRTGPDKGEHGAWRSTDRPCETGRKAQSQPFGASDFDPAVTISPRSSFVAASHSAKQLSIRDLGDGSCRARTDDLGTKRRPVRSRGISRRFGKRLLDGDCATRLQTRASGGLCPSRCHRVVTRTADGVEPATEKRRRAPAPPERGLVQARAREALAGHAVHGKRSRLRGRVAARLRLTPSRPSE